MKYRVRMATAASGNPPAWALDLVERVCIRNVRSVPDLVWRRPKGRVESSGRCTYSRITISAGKDRFGQKRVLLHELAHWVRKGPGARWGHDDTFYRALYRLAKEEGVSCSKVMKGEAWYRAQATRTAAALGIRGAKAEGRRARATRVEWNRGPSPAFIAEIEAAARA